MADAASGEADPGRARLRHAVPAADQPHFLCGNPFILSPTTCVVHLQAPVDGSTSTVSISSAEMSDDGLPSPSDAPGSSSHTRRRPSPTGSLTRGGTPLVGSAAAGSRPAGAGAGEAHPGTSPRSASGVGGLLASGASGAGSSRRWAGARSRLGPPSTSQPPSQRSVMAEEAAFIRGTLAALKQARAAPGGRSGLPLPGLPTCSWAGP
jgi:hypothetical protein